MPWGGVLGLMDFEDFDWNERLETLTDRCREVAKLRAEGLTTGQIAKELQLPVKEVKKCLDALWGWGGDAGAPVG